MALDYTSYIASIANLTALDSTQPEFVQIIPEMIAYAEQRIYRELNLIYTRVVNSTKFTTPNDREFRLPVNAVGPNNLEFITVTNVNIITPAGQTATGTGTRVPLQHMPSTVVDYLAPSNTPSTMSNYPLMYYMKDQWTLILGPAPAGAYNVEVLGTIRPAPLAVGNPETFLTKYLPDLFLSASMIFMSGYMRDFGSQADNPQQAQSWENQYQLEFKSANGEEMRKRYNEETFKQ